MKLHRPLSPGIRAQLMLFLAFICLLLLGMYWFLATQLLEPLYNRRIEDQLAGQADEIVELIAEAEANGSVISQWDFGVLVVDNTFRTRLYESLAANTQLINSERAMTTNNGLTISATADGARYSGRNEKTAISVAPSRPHFGPSAPRTRASRKGVPE